MSEYPFEQSYKLGGWLGGGLTQFNVKGKIEGKASSLAPSSQHKVGSLTVPAVGLVAVIDGNVESDRGTTVQASLGPLHVWQRKEMRLELLRGKCDGSPACAYVTYIRAW